MKQISKQVAQEVAQKIAADTIGKKIETLLNEIDERADLIIKKKIPQILLDNFLKYRDYFNDASYIRLRFGIIESNFDIMAKTKYPSNGHYRRVFDVDENTYNWFLGKNAEMRLLNSERKQMINTIESTLFSLRTPKRVLENFEQAYKYLPVENDEEKRISLPIEELNILINKYK